MEARVSRESFLRALESVRPGLCDRELVEQSTCFAFQAGKVFTYNDETSVSGPSGLPEELSCAVKAEEMLESLRKLIGEELRVRYDPERNQLLVREGRTTVGFSAEGDVRLPFGAVDKPGEYRPLPEDFGEAVDFVQGCAGKDTSRWVLTCVNIAPEWIEACDDIQLCRWNMATGVTQAILIKQMSASGLRILGVSQISEGKNWVHFRNDKGFVLSCRRYVDDFPSEELTPVLAEEGKKVSLPKSIKDACEAADVFTRQQTENNVVMVTIRPGTVVVEGRGLTGWYRRKEPANWDGPEIAFRVSPKLLGEIVNKYNVVELTDRVIRVNTGSYVYVTCLSAVEAEKPRRKREKVEA